MSIVNGNVKFLSDESVMALVYDHELRSLNPYEQAVYDAAWDELMERGLNGEEYEAFCEMMNAA